MENKKNVPEIRFKGFAEEWNESKMGRIGIPYNGLSGKTKDDFGHGDAKFITYMNVFSNPVSNLSQTENVEIDNKQNSVKYGDILFTVSSETPDEVGMSSVWLGNEDNIYLNSFCFGYRLIVHKDPYYMAYVLRSKSIRKLISLLAQGISRYNISKGRVMEIALPFPDNNEQKAIGNYFQNIDKLIVASQAKLGKLKTIKKACLEKMFPCNGSNIPEIRFKGFTKDWETKKVRELLLERNTQYPKSEEYPLMAFIAYEGVAPKGERYNRESLVNDEINKKYKQTEYGDFIYSSNNLETGSIGLNKYGSASISPVYSIFRPTEIADSDFIGRLLIRQDFINKMIKWRQGVIYGQWRIHESDFLAIEILAPSLSEQTRIGIFFKHLDDLITKAEQQINKLKNIKKACLDKMFANRED